MQNKDNSKRVVQRDKIKTKIELREFNWTQKQLELANFIEEKGGKIIIIDGVAGSGKTLVSMYSALKLLINKKISEILYLRSAIESSSRSLGWTPGTLEEKFSYYLAPLEEKLAEILKKSEIDLLKKEKRINALPIAYLRGVTWNVNCILLDEAQNTTKEELITIMTRLGEHSKLIIMGDSRQKDIKNSGFEFIYKLFDDEESAINGIRCFKFDSDDIMRSGIVKYIIKKLESQI